MKRRLMIIGAVVIVAIVAVGAVLWIRLDDTTPVRATDALSEYRENPTPGQAGPGLPAPGVYEYRVRGSEVIRSGPLVVDRTLPPIAPMIIRHTDRGYETDIRYSEEHTELSRYELRPDGAYLVFGRAEVGAIGFSTTTTTDWQPPLLLLPLAPEVGQRWGGHFTAGDLELQIEGEVLRREAVEVGGERVRAFVIELRQQVAGEYTGERTETFWYDPETALVVRYSIDSRLDGSTDFDQSGQQTLVSLTPQT